MAITSATLDAVTFPKWLAEIQGLKDTIKALNIFIGPEGGFSQEEIESARAQGFRTVGLGPRILRVETAALVAVALTQSAVGGLD